MTKKQDPETNVVGIALPIASELALEAVRYFVQQRQIADATPAELEAVKAEHARLMREHYDGARQGWDDAGAPKAEKAPEAAAAADGPEATEAADAEKPGPSKSKGG